MRAARLFGAFALVLVAACSANAEPDEAVQDSENPIRTLNAGEKLGSIAFGDVKTFEYANTNGNKYRSYTFRATAGDRVVARVLSRVRGTSAQPPESSWPLLWIAASSSGANVASSTKDSWSGPADYGDSLNKLVMLGAGHRGVFAVIPRTGEYRIVVRDGAYKTASMAVSLQKGCDPDDEGWNTACPPPFVPHPSLDEAPPVKNTCTGTVSAAWLKAQAERPQQSIPPLAILGSPLSPGRRTTWTRSCDVLGKCSAWKEGPSVAVETWVAGQYGMLGLIDRDGGVAVYGSVQTPKVDGTYDFQFFPLSSPTFLGAVGPAHASDTCLAMGGFRDFSRESAAYYDATF